MEEKNYDVLIVDDDEKSRILLKKQFLAKGLSVKLADSFKEAVDAVNISLPKVLVVDYYIGTKRATDIIKYLTTIHNLQDTLIIIYTASRVQPSDRNYCEEMYNCKLLDKLSDSELLYKLVEDRVRLLKNGGTHGKG